MRIHGRLDWGRLARIHLLDGRQHRAPQACPKPGQGGSNTVHRRDCAALDDPSRSLLGTAQEQWLADGWDAERPWNLVAQQTLMARFAWSDPADRGGVVWTDGWDGYAPARRRLLAPVAARKLPGVVVLGGDVHTHYVADLQADFDDPASPVVASEFCGTSISSRSLAQPRIDAALAFNPHVKLGRAESRGYVRFAVRERRLDAELMAVADVSRPDSAVGVMARFVVEAGRPGPQAA
jgi:alkaline phosphatase D